MTGIYEDQWQECEPSVFDCLLKTSCYVYRNQNQPLLMKTVHILSVWSSSKSFG